MQAPSMPNSVLFPLPRSIHRMLSSVLSFSVDPHSYEMIVDFSTEAAPSSIEVPNTSHLQHLLFQNNVHREHRESQLEENKISSNFSHILSSRPMAETIHATGSVREGAHPHAIVCNQQDDSFDTQTQTGSPADISEKCSKGKGKAKKVHFSVDERTQQSSHFSESPLSSPFQIAGHFATNVSASGSSSLQPLQPQPETTGTEATARLTPKNSKKRAAPTTDSPSRDTKRKKLNVANPYDLPRSKAIYRTGSNFTWYKTTSSGSISEPPPIPENLIISTGDLFVHEDTTSTSPMPQVWQAISRKWEPVLPFSTTRIIQNDCYVISIHWAKKEPSWVLWNSVQKMNRYIVEHLGNNHPGTSKSARSGRSRKTKTP